MPWSSSSPGSASRWPRRRLRPALRCPRASSRSSIASLISMQTRRTGSTNSSSSRGSDPSSAFSEPLLSSSPPPSSPPQPTATRARSRDQQQPDRTGKLRQHHGEPFVVHPRLERPRRSGGPLGALSAAVSWATRRASGSRKSRAAADAAGAGRRCRAPSWPAGAPAGRIEVGGGDRLDPLGVVAGGLQDRPGELVPGHRALVGHVEHAPAARSTTSSMDHRRQVVGEGRVAPLVVDEAQAVRARRPGAGWS